MNAPSVSVAYRFVAQYSIIATYTNSATAVLRSSKRQCTYFIASERKAG